MRARWQLVSLLTMLCAAFVWSTHVAVRAQSAAPQNASPPSAAASGTAGEASPDRSNHPAAAGSAQAGEVPAATRLTGVTVDRRADGIVVTIRGNGRLAYSAIQEADRPPARLVVDFQGVRPDVAASTAGQGVVRRVRVALNNADPVVTRVVLDLERLVSHRVRAANDGRDLIIALEAPAAAGTETTTAAAKPAPVEAGATPTPARNGGGAARGAGAGASSGAAAARASTEPPTERVATRLASVALGQAPEGATLTLKGNGRLVPKPIEQAKDAPPRLVLDLPGVRPGPGVAALTHVNQGVVDRVRIATASTRPLMTRVVLQMKGQFLYRMRVGQTDPSEVTITIADPTSQTEPSAEFVLADEVGPASGGANAGGANAGGANAAAATTGGASSGAAASAPSRSGPSGSGPSGSGASGAGASGAGAARREAPARGAPSAPASQNVTAESMEPVRPTHTGTTGDRNFSGRPVSLDFQGVDLRAVLRTFSEITSLNVVIDPGVKGTVDVSLREVPWDQALDIILRANQLGYSIEGSIVRIAPLDILAREEQVRRALKEEQDLSGELKTLTRPLSYAKAQELSPLLLKSALTKRGTIETDLRTNTLIVKDLQMGLDQARLLMDTLDTPQPQVEIEARIIETQASFSKELGIRLGFNGTISPALGNTLPLTFPNQGDLGGLAGNVNQQAPNLLQTTLTAINGAFSINAALSALETEGKVKVISAPRVIMQNNVEGEILQGTQIPYTTATSLPSGDGGILTTFQVPTVAFKDAALKLTVKPRITASGTVIMEVALERSAPNYVNALPGNPNPAIDTQKARTTIQVSDGATALIGGVMFESNNSNDDRTPGLHKVPILGRMFNRTRKQGDTRELVLLITPKIVKG